MSLFARSLRLLQAIIGFVAGVTAIAAALIARYLIAPPRQRLWSSPTDLDLAYDEVHFPARDGLRLAGWFIPAGEAPGPAVILLHGWPWNRLGDGGEHLLAQLSGTPPLALLGLVHALQQAGYHVLAYDARNHGQSGSAPPVTFGLYEAQDLLGAVDFLEQRPEVEGNAIGVVGFSMGANTLLYALPHTEAIRAGVAVQPIAPGPFARRLAYHVLGPLSHLALPLAQYYYQLQGGPSLDALQPQLVAAGAGDVSLLLIQGSGDAWGSVPEANAIAAALPAAPAPLLVPGHGRYAGYQWALDNPQQIVDFLKSNMG